MCSICLSKSFSKILAHPYSVLTLIGVIIILLVLLNVKKIKLTPRLMTQIGLALALATILNMFKITELPSGGAITPGAMIPIILVALLYGPEVGFLTGFLYGLISLVLGPYILHPVQVLFDYPLPFMALGLAGYFKNKKLLGTLVAIIGRFIFHFISGIVFWGANAPDTMSPYLYSLVYNGIYLGANAIICIVIIQLLPISNLYTILNRNSQHI